MPNPVSASKSNWSVTVADAQKRLKKLDEVLRGAQRVDGSVDLVKAKALAGKDFPVSALIDAARPDRFSPNLSAEQARSAFVELQRALQSAPQADTNRDGQIGYDERWSLSVSGDQAKQLVNTAATAGLPQPGEKPAMQSFNSVAARQGAEARISAVAEWHAQTPEGAEALKWSMRRDLVDGMNPHDPALFDAVNHSETGWQARIPLFGKKSREGRGHLSNAELEARFGNLEQFSARTAREVNDRVLMDYQREYLTGKDLP